MTAERTRPRGFYARLARARGVSFHAVYLQLNPDKRTCARAQRECDATLPWSRVELIRMDRAFCDAMRREIARGTERARGPAARSAVVRLARRLHPAPRRSGCSSAAALCAEIGDTDRIW
jgi:hypothetical protein